MWGLGFCCLGHGSALTPSPLLLHSLAGTGPHLEVWRGGHDEKSVPLLAVSVVAVVVAVIVLVMVVAAVVVVVAVVAAVAVVAVAILVIALVLLLYVVVSSSLSWLWLIFCPGCCLSAASFVSSLLLSMPMPFCVRYYLVSSSRLGLVSRRHN